MSVAQTILEQMGTNPRRLALMLGVSSLVSYENGVKFRFKARAKNGANMCHITLTPDDSYTVDFISCRGLSTKVKSSFSGLYADMLKDLFERETGLYLSL